MLIGQQQVHALTHDDACAADGTKGDAARTLFFVPIVTRVRIGTGRRLAFARHRHPDNDAALDCHLRPFHGLCGGRSE